MELRHLRYFVAVAEELNFRRAAERLFIAQPPLSQQIQQLEQELGVLLFDRSRRAIALTPAGTALYQDAVGILDRCEAAMRRARRFGAGVEGTLRIGFAPSATYHLLPESVRVFRERYPDVSLELLELLGPEQTQALHDLRIDVGIAIEATPDEAVTVEEVAEIPLVVALPSDHRLAHLEVVSLSQVTREPFIHFPRLERSGYRRFVERLWERQGRWPPIALETEELQTALGLVSAGLGCTFAPAPVAGTQRSGLVFRPLDRDDASIRLGLAMRRGETSPLVQRFAAVVRMVAQAD